MTKICPVCKKDGAGHVTCYRPDCTDGRYLVDVKVYDDVKEHIKDICRRFDSALKRLANR